MFVSQSQYEFPFPPNLAEPGTQHWRIVELTLHAPWFMVSVEIIEPEHPDCSITRTLCIAWDTDLAELLSALDPDRVKGIVCMMPAWQSPTGQWWSREIREVWVYSSPGGKHVVLVDNAGEKFDCGLIPEPVGDIEMDLLLRVDPKPAGPAPNRRARRAARHGKKSS